MNPDITIPKWLKVIFVVGLQASVLGGLVWYARATGTNINLTSGPVGRHMPPVPRPPPPPPPKKKPKPVKAAPKGDKAADKAAMSEEGKAKNDEKNGPDDKPPLLDETKGADGTPKASGDKP